MTQPSAPSLLGVFAHPDDESLLAGGVLAQHADAGARTAVVTATWTVGSHRAPELANALTALGAGAPHLLGYADARNPNSAPGGATRLVDAPLDEAVGRLVADIRQFQPDIVIGHDALGQLTGHPDHRHTHHITLIAVEAAGLPHLYPDAGQPWQPSAFYAATHPQSAITDLGPLLSEVGKTLLTVPDEYVTAVVDVTAWLDRKWAAICSHLSQLKGKRPLPALLSRADAQRRDSILATEYFTRLSLPCGGPATSKLTGSPPRLW
ncbi:PIG-L deacetylase family protein [Streptomyces lydicus]|uniref:PIG-L deacetylase family protein n=1 Tax=Streptomyces lydicus TaxID=47763 RepID=UPI00286FB85C|nr:PIG-L deacetylase family protein [Streptomyces lydicus]